MGTEHASANMCDRIGKTSFIVQFGGDIIEKAFLFAINFLYLNEIWGTTRHQSFIFG